MLSFCLNFKLAAPCKTTQSLGHAKRGVVIEIRSITVVSH